MSYRCEEIVHVNWQLKRKEKKKMGKILLSMNEILEHVVHMLITRLCQRVFVFLRADFMMAFGKKNRNEKKNVFSCLSLIFYLIFLVRSKHVKVFESFQESNEIEKMRWTGRKNEKYGIWILFCAGFAYYTREQFDLQSEFVEQYDTGDGPKCRNWKKRKKIWNIEGNADNIDIFPEANILNHTSFL